MSAENSIDEPLTAARPASRGVALLDALTARVGPYGETAAAAAAGCAIALLLFMPERKWVWVAAAALVGLSAFLLRAAVHHARREGEEQEAVTYQLTETRVRTLQAARVPRDIIETMNLALKNSTAVPPAIPPEPKGADEFLEWLAYDLGLGRKRVEESRATILNYAEYEGPRRGGSS